MLDIDKLIIHYDAPFLEMIEGVYCRRFKYCIRINYVINNRKIGYYKPNTKQLFIISRIWNQIYRSYYMCMHGSDNRLLTVKGLFERNMGIQVCSFG